MKIELDGDVGKLQPLLRLPGPWMDIRTSASQVANFGTSSVRLSGSL